ncbi:MAG TPA: NAD(P)H-binding protein [Mucilaginibacter sp.]
MKTILVTGGTGNLGKEVVHQLINKSYQVSILSSQQNLEFDKAVEIFKGDLGENTGLVEAMADADIIVHCASSPKDPQKIDIEGTGNLLAAIDKNKTRHFIYISIVGVDKSDYPYYQAKYKVEKMIAESGLPYSILRTTQFHSFIYNMIKSFVSDDNSIQIPQGMRFQPIELKEVAVRIVQLVENGATGLLPHTGGPQVLSIEDMVLSYLNIFGLHQIFQPMPIGSPRYDLFRSGINLCPANAVGLTTWEEFLGRQFDN